MIPRGIGALIAMPLAGRLVGKVQGRYLVAGGFLSFGLGTYVLAQLSLDLTPWVLFWPLFFSGVSIAFMFVPLNTLALGALKPEQIGNASGIFNLMRNVGGSVGISMVTTLLARTAQTHQTTLVADLTPYDTGYQTSIQSVTSAFPVGLPSELLLCRPDVQQAERQLAAATANIGVAKADLFPKFYLTGVAGFESISASDWFTAGSRFWSAGPTVQWQIFDAGRIRANITVQNAKQEEALAAYEQAALTAFEETLGLCVKIPSVY